MASVPCEVAPWIGASKVRGSDGDGYPASAWGAVATIARGLDFMACPLLARFQSGSCALAAVCVGLPV